MRLILIFPILACLTFASCGLGSSAGVEAAKQLSESADKAGGQLKQISDDWRKEFENGCKLTDTKISQMQATLNATCQAITDAHAQQQCDELNRQANDLIEKIRKDCQ